MRIALVSTLATAVRGDRAGSVESLVWLLAREFTELGHEVTVFAAGGSDVTCRLVETVAAPYTWDGGFADWQLAEWVNLVRATERSADFDVIHTHAYLWGLALSRLSRSPLVATMHVLPDVDSAALRRAYPDVEVTALSSYQWEEFPDLPAATVIPSGLDPTCFESAGDPADYLLWLGRFTPSKGPREAIEVARRVGRPLVLAAPPTPYFHDVIKPLVDGEQVVYAGYLGGREKVTLLGRAAALLYPVQAPEPFGLVLIEAMLSGTPVAALGIGAVPELVDPGLTGCVASDLDGLVEIVPTVLSLDRDAVRRRAVARFSARRMANDYLRVYEEVVR